MALQSSLHGEPAAAEFAKLAGRIRRGSVNGRSINVGRHLILLLSRSEGALRPDGRQGTDKLHAALIERSVERIIRRNDDREAVRMTQRVLNDLTVLAARHSRSVLSLKSTKKQ